MLMNPRRRLILLAATLVGGVGAAAQATEQSPADNRSQSDWQQLHVTPVTDDTYRSACGSCHMAYQPGLLSAQSWEKLLATLTDHFSENAELPQPALNAVRNYLLSNAAGRVLHRLPYRMMKSMHPNDVPLRISEVPYFIEEHRGLPAEVVQGNPEVRSFSHCEACHSQAEAGNYEEDAVRIPGYPNGISHGDR